MLMMLSWKFIENLGLLLGLSLVLFTAALMFYLYWTKSDADLSYHDSENYFVDTKTKRRRTQFPSIDDPPEIDLSIIVPAYNEESRLSVMMDEALEYLTGRQKKNPGFQYEIIVVDDGSTDKTSQGILRGRGHLLMFADADGATRFSDVKKLEEALQKILSESQGEDQMAVVCGSRAHLEKDSIAQRSIIRTFLMYGFHFLVSFLCVHGVRDTQCGFKLFTRSAARLLFYNLHIQRWAFDVELLHIAQHFGVPLAEVAVNWTEIPGSKLSPLWASLQIAWDLFMIRLRYLSGSWKMSIKPKRQ